MTIQKAGYIVLNISPVWYFYANFRSHILCCCRGQTLMFWYRFQVSSHLPTGSGLPWLKAIVCHKLLPRTMEMDITVAFLAEGCSSPHYAVNSMLTRKLLTYVTLLQMTSRITLLTNISHLAVGPPMHIYERLGQSLVSTRSICGWSVWL